MPMYDIPEIREALDALWTGLRRYLVREGLPGLPQSLTHGSAFADRWDDPRLLLSQCCGHDIVHRYAGKLRPIATRSRTTIAGAIHFGAGSSSAQRRLIA